MSSVPRSKADVRPLGPVRSNWAGRTRLVRVRIASEAKRTVLGSCVQRILCQCRRSDHHCSTERRLGKSDRSLKGLHDTYEQDGAEPSASSVAVHNLPRIALLFEDEYEQWYGLAVETYTSVSKELTRFPMAIGYTVAGLMDLQRGYKSVSTCFILTTPFIFSPRTSTHQGAS